MLYAWPNLWRNRDMQSLGLKLRYGQIKKSEEKDKHKDWRDVAWISVHEMVQEWISLLLAEVRELMQNRELWYQLHLMTVAAGHILVISFISRFLLATVRSSAFLCVLGLVANCHITPR